MNSSRLIRRPAKAGNVGVFAFGAGLYLFRELPAVDGGRGFRVWRLGSAEPYSVLVDGRKSSCECLGFSARGYCRHVQFMRGYCGG